MIRLKKRLLFLVCALATWLSAQTAQATIAQVPLFLGGSVEPNIMFTLDDSGSMHWEFMPDQDMVYSIFMFPRPAGVYGGGDYTNQVPSFDDNSLHNFFGRSAQNNKIFYNPNITYRPWSDREGTGTPEPNADPKAAYYNPYDTSKGSIDLTQQQTQYALWFENTTDTDLWRTTAAWWGDHTFWPITYYVYDGSGSVRSRSNYTRVQITSSTPASATFTSPDGEITRTRDQEIQNFANWFQYYRSRILLARAGVGQAFGMQDDGIRVGFATINQGLIDGVSKFTLDSRKKFFSSLYGHIMEPLGTPLRRALDTVGQYYDYSGSVTHDDDHNPWRDDPEDSDSNLLSCRQSYNILMSDGYWNGATVTTAGATNADDTDGPSISGPASQSYEFSSNPYQYEPARPFSDGFSNTLADVAMYYWKRDLYAGLDNMVPLTDENNPAFWQHMVTFTVGLGVKGTLSYPDDLQDIIDGDKSWPDPVTGGDQTKVDDMWHTAVNSRGGFFSASNPVEFATALAGSLADIIGNVGSSASIATNSTRLDSDTYVYQARFDSRDWSGKLLGFKLDTSGDVGSDPDWEASVLLDALGSSARTTTRKIFTYDAAKAASVDGPGVEFLWNDDLPGSIKDDLDMGPSGTDGEGAGRLAYLRGVQAREVKEDGGALDIFRKRNSILGDIVNSDPWFAGQQDYGYNLLPSPEGPAYVTYRNSDAYKDRPGVVYTGAGDGMLHGFNAVTGEELLAYIPGSVVPDLWRLTDPGYKHRYYVDGPPVAKDVYLDSTWKTILVGTTGAGGKGLFALDVTDPMNFSKSDVMWEFVPDTDLGYTIGQASVVRMANGEWVAVFGNSYGSDSGKAVLYIVDLADGSVIKKIDTDTGGTGSMSAGIPNGLSTPNAVDINGDRIVDRIYAGDLLGNMWAFDVSHKSDTDQWEVDYKSGSNPAPLFTASYTVSDPDQVQPITSKPQVGIHPHGGVMVYFGTGKYFEVGDGSLADKNTFYGIRDDFSADKPTPISGRDELVEQTITHESIKDSSDNLWLSDAAGNLTSYPFSWELRVSTEHDVDYQSKRGWALDLKSPVIGWEGERQVSPPLLLEDRIIFSTMIPSQNPCEYGGTGWLMEIASLTGARLSVTPFDLNGDGLFNAEDYVSILTGETDSEGNPITKKVPVSGKRSKVGIIKTPAVVQTKDKEYKFTSGSTGELERTLESRGHRVGRQSWRQIR